MVEGNAVGPDRAPAVVRIAAVLVTVQGVAAIAGVIAVLVDAARRAGRAVAGELLLGACGAAVAGLILLAGIMLYRGRWWPRPIVTVVQILVFPLALALFAGGAPELGIPLALVAAAVLALLFSPPSNRWMAIPYDLSIPAPIAD